MSDLAKFLLKAYARKLLAMLGVYLIAHGVDVGSNFVEQFLEPVVGSALIISSAVWTGAYQWYVKRKVNAARFAHAGISKDELEQLARK